MQMNEIDFIYIVSAVFFSVAPVFTAIIVRDSVKRHRTKIIEELDRFFGNAAGEPILHSFEFVKFKYFVGAGANVADDFRPEEWIILAIPLFLLIVFGNILCVSFLTQAIGLPDQSYLPPQITCFLKSAQLFSYACLSAYAGSYVFMIRAFYQAVNNFDLSPCSMLGAFNNIVFGLIFGILSYVMVSFAVKNTNAIILTCFLGGYMPDVILRKLTATRFARWIKQERLDVFQQAKSVPIEIIDGIDSAVRYRLSDFHINNVQNLASANPIMLFVETPYGVYQMLDWVAQAQLCATVGVKNLFDLWDIGIRTIFDLELIALHPDFRETMLFQQVGKIICGQGSTDEAIVRSIKTRVENPYTQRLRQIFIRVAEKLGDDSKSFPYKARFRTSLECVTQTFG